MLAQKRGRPSKGRAADAFPAGNLLRRAARQRALQLLPRLADYFSTTCCSLCHSFVDLGPLRALLRRLPPFAPLPPPPLPSLVQTPRGLRSSRRLTDRHGRQELRRGICADAHLRYVSSPHARAADVRPCAFRKCWPTNRRVSADPREELSPLTTPRAPCAFRALSPHRSRQHSLER
jgi:hypothetical protein